MEKPTTSGHCGAYCTASLKKLPIFNSMKRLIFVISSAKPLTRKKLLVLSPTTYSWLASQPSVQGNKRSKDHASVVKLVDTSDSKSDAFGRGGSSPPTGTMNLKS